MIERWQGRGKGRCTGRARQGTRGESRTRRDGRARCVVMALSFAVIATGVVPVHVAHAQSGEAPAAEAPASTQPAPLVGSPSMTAPAAPVVARARKEGSGYVVELAFTVAATQDLVWDVLTDFDQMAQILSSVDSSRVLNRKGDDFDLEQKSHSTAGPVRLSTSNVRHVTLVPKTEIRSRLASADTLKSSDFTTRIAPQGALVRVDVRGTFVPALLASAVINTENIQAQLSRQYTELRDEILRRKNGQPRPACLARKDCP